MSILIGVLILWNAWLIIREAIDILLESTPDSLEVSSLIRDILQLDAVRGVHHLHVWSLSRNLKLLTAHIVVDDMPISAATAIQKAVQEIIQHRHGITRCTLQMEYQGCEPDTLYADMQHAGDHHAHTHHHAHHPH